MIAACELGRTHFATARGPSIGLGNLTVGMAVAGAVAATFALEPLSHVRLRPCVSSRQAAWLWSGSGSGRPVSAPTGGIYALLRTADGLGPRVAGRDLLADGRAVSWTVSTTCGCVDGLWGTVTGAPAGGIDRSPRGHLGHSPAWDHPIRARSSPRCAYILR